MSKLQKNYDNGRVSYRSLVPHIPSGTPAKVQKRYYQFTALAPGFNKGPSVTEYYDAMLQGQLEFTLDGKQALVDPLMTENVRKDDAPLTNADTGAFNAIYGGLQAVIQVTQNSKFLNALPQTVWPQSGFRVVSSQAFSSGLGVADSSDRPATEESTYVEIGVSPKLIAKTFELGMIMTMQGETDDAVQFALNKDVIESAFMNSWDADMLQDGNTLAGNNFESVDRYTASYTTASNLSWTANDENWHGVERNATNAYWDAASYDNSGTDRYLTRSLVDTALYAVLPYFTDPSDFGKLFMATGHKTMPSFKSLEEAKQILTVERTSFGPDGVQRGGQDTGLVMSGYMGVPIVLDFNVQTDTIQRIYGVNTEYAGIAMGRPLELIVSDDPLKVGHNKLGEFFAIGEFWGTKPKSAFAIRDLK